MPFGETSLGDQFVGQGVGLVLVLALLVLDDAALLVELGLGDRAQEVAHPVRFGPKGDLEGRRGDVLKIVRPVLAGRPVEVGRPDLLHQGKIVLVVVLRAVEHQVLEKMGESGFSGFLVFRADMVPNVEGHDRGFVILVDDDGQAVVQDRLVEGNVGRGGQLSEGQGRGQGQGQG